MRNYLPKIELWYKEYDLLDYINNSDNVYKSKNFDLSKETNDLINWIKIWLDPIFSNYSFSNRYDTLKLLRVFWKEKESNIIWIDWSEFSTNIKKIDSTQANWTILEKSWIDWIVFEWINDINHRVWILLWVADCAWIVWLTKDWNNIFNIHWWYKWILWKKDWWFWIIAQLLDILRKENYNPEDIVLNISPMAWDDFELWRDFIEEMFNDFKKSQLSESLKYKFNFDDYFIDTYSLNWEQKWDFNLRKLIIDILELYWIKNYSYTDIDTTSNNNLFSSYRLHNQSKNNNHQNFWSQLVDSRMWVYIWNKKKE